MILGVHKQPTVVLSHWIRRSQLQHYILQLHLSNLSFIFVDQDLNDNYEQRQIIN